MTKDLNFRDPKLVKTVSKKIQQIVPKYNVKICHICGTHEWTITHYGLRELLPRNVEVIAGPGCPVCIVPASEIDEAVELAKKGIVLTCFGDVHRVPGSKKSLMDAKAEGADVRIVYSLADVVKMARREKNKEFTFFSVGFETTTPSTALEVKDNPPKNLSFLISNRLIPPAMELLVKMKDLNLNGFIAPGHVSTIIGLNPYHIFPQKYGMPTVVTGFEPLDVMFGVYMILRQLVQGKPKLDNEYTRVVRSEGNIKAQTLLKEIFDVTSGIWRGLGEIQDSKYRFNEKFVNLDAHLKYGVRIERGLDIQPGCKCHLIIVGKLKPIECPLFQKSCTPQTPVGACMVSNEGTCRIWSSEYPSL